MAKFSLLKVYKRVDIFGRGVSFEADGEGSVKSCLGATMTLLVTFITLAYAWTRFDVLVKFGDIRI